MRTDTEIRSLGFRALASTLGPVEAERFVTLLAREPFDYTEWRRGLWEGRDIAEISRSAMSARESQPSAGSEVAEAPPK
ncbi:MAG: hypothetical protein P9M08_08585 [Candidatus Erginobacter occultus]|nr:hypothetical protein [Candidatus Erginobacter occultus]